MVTGSIGSQHSAKVADYLQQVSRLGDRLKNQQLVLYLGAIVVKPAAETGKNSLQLISGCIIIAHLFRKLLTGEFGSNDRNFQQID